MCSADADSKIQSAEGMHDPHAENYGKLSPILHNDPAATAVVSHGLRAWHGRGQAANLAKSVIWWRSA